MTFHCHTWRLIWLTDDWFVKYWYLSNAVLYFSQLCLFKLPVRGSKVKLAIISIMNMVWLFSLPTPILICPTPCLDSTPPPSSTVAVCSKYHHHQILSKDSPIYSSLPSRWWPWQCFVRTGTWLVLFQQEFWPSCERPNISVGGYFRRGWEWDTCGDIWWFTGTGVKVPSWQCE